MKPLVVAEGGGDAVAAVVARLRAGGAEVVDGFDRARDGVVCVGAVTDDATAASAVLAVVRGAGVVVDGRADRAVLDRLCDDLRRLGPVEHLVDGALPSDDAPALSDDQRALLALLADGRSLGEAAAALHLSRRTADRRLAAAREALGVRTTTEAVLRIRRS